MGKTTKMKKYHADLEPSYDSDPKEDSGSEMENWPNGKLILIRFIGWLVIWGSLGAIAAATLWILGTIVVNKIMEQ